MGDLLHLFGDRGEKPPKPYTLVDKTDIEVIITEAETALNAIGAAFSALRDTEPNTFSTGIGAQVANDLREHLGNLSLAVTLLDDLLVPPDLPQADG